MTYSLAVNILRNRIINVCRSQYKSFEVVEREFGVGVRFCTQGGWVVAAIAHETGLMVSSLLPLVVPPERRAQLIELLNRINTMSVAGMLELLHDEGQIRLRHCVGASPAFISTRIVRDSLRFNSTMTRYAIPKLSEFLHCGVSAEEMAANWLPTPSGSTSSGASKTISPVHRPYPPRFHLN